MAHFARCARDYMPLPASSALDSTTEPDPKMQIKSGNSLTWQQQQDFGAQKPRRNKRRTKAPNPGLLKSAPAAAAEPTPIITRPVLRLPTARPTTPGDVLTSTTPLHDRNSALATSPLPPQDSGNVVEKTRANHKRYNHCGKFKPEKMTVQTSGASIPPHLRKRAAAAAAKPKPDVRLGDFIGGITPPTSVASQGEKIVHTQDVPNDAANQEPVPLSPPVSVETPGKPAPEFAGWDDPLPERPVLPVKQRDNPRWPRTYKSPKQKHVWLKSRDIPRKLPSDSQSDGGVTFKSNSDGDPTYDVKKLMDWNGDWLPPPVEWAARKGFTHRHFGQAIEQWANEHSRNCTDVMNVDFPAFIGTQSPNGEWLNKDLVPRYWLHDSIDATSPREFWEDLPQRAPPPLSDLNIMESPPYWERWEDDQQDNCFMTTLVVPEAKIDSNDTENELESPFAMLCIEDRVAMIFEIRENRKRRSQAKRDRPVTVRLLETTPPCLQPKANIMLRPVQPSDIRGIMTIYNHYVKNTVHAVELEEQTEGQIRDWIDGIVQADLPCLVAVAKQSQRRGPQSYVSDTIVGFIHLEEYVSPSSMYRFTFELALYVHPEYLRKGIGSCLLDQLMFMVNTGYNKKGGFEWVNDFEYLKNGKSRVVKSIVVGVHYERGDNVDWVTSYLGGFGFKRAGRFAQIGHKSGKVIDKVVFQAQTTEIIEPNTVPML